SHVPAHTQAAWLMECTAAFGELRRMTQFKDKSNSTEFVSGGLFTYPALMAADILLYDTTNEPVGQDQRQNVELPRALAEPLHPGAVGTFSVRIASHPVAAARAMDIQPPTS